MEFEETKLSHHVARAFTIVCAVICSFLAISVLVLLFSAPYILGLGLMFAAIAILPIPVFIWGITLFIRYRRLLENKLNMSEQRLWIETIVLNILNLGLCVWPVSTVQSLLPLYGIVLIALWNVIAIVLSILALRKRQPQMV